MHRNPNVWADPESFDPSRFEDKARKERNPFAYLPFGGGPRKCIGSNMAIMQMLIIFTFLIRRYDFELVSDAPVDISPMMILHPKDPIEMRVRRIS
jgi:cytochrome P450